MGRDSISKVVSVDRWHYFAVRVAIVLLIVLMSCGNSFAYSVLTHEEIVDLLWTAEIRPLLLQRYPALSEDQLEEAPAYAYGSAVIYAQSLSQLANQKFDLTSGALRDNILQFYSDLSAQIETKKDGVRWKAVLTKLDQLKAVAQAPTVASSPAQ